MAEYYGDGRADGGLGHSVYWPGAHGTNAAGGLVNSQHVLPRGQSWGSGYHVYSVEWTPTEYIFRVDGHQVMHTVRGVSAQPQVIVLSELTSDWELPVLKAASRPTSVDVD